MIPTTLIPPTTQILSTKEIISSIAEEPTNQILSTKEIVSSIAEELTTQIITTKTTTLHHELIDSTILIQESSNLFNCSYLLLLQNLCSFLVMDNT